MSDTIAAAVELPADLAARLNAMPQWVDGAAARRLIPGRDGKRMAPSTWTRWCQRGVRLPDGRRLRLPAVRIGHRWVVGRGDLAAFLAELTAACLPASAATPVRTPHARTRAASAAGDALTSEFGV